MLARENLSDHKSLDKRLNKLRQRLWKIRAKKVILATGAIERPLIFNNNDRPGVMLANAVKKYIDFFGVRCGDKNIIFTNNDTAYETAISLNKKGIEVVVIDIRKNSSSTLVQTTKDAGIKIYWNHTIVNTSGYRRIKSIQIMQMSEDGTNVVGKKTSLLCDNLSISGGWTPMVHLFTQSGGKLKFRESDQVFLPNTAMSDQISIGSCNGEIGRAHV